MAKPKKIQKTKECEYCHKIYVPFEGVNTKYWKLSRFCSKSCSAYSRKDIYSENCKKIGKLPTSNEEREKLRIIAKNKPINQKAVEGMRKANTGRKNKWKGIKMVDLVKLNIITQEQLDKKIEVAIKTRQKFGSKKITNIEKIVYDLLVYKNIEFEFQKDIDRKYLVDFYIPSKNLVIEADGDYWHSLDKCIKSDKLKNKYLEDNGFNLERWRGVSILKDINSLSKRLDLYS